MKTAWLTPHNNLFSNPCRAALLQRRITWVILAIICVIYVGGWLLNFEALIRFKTGFPATVRSTLVCATLCAFALLTLNHKPPGYPLIIRGLGALVVAICAYLILPGHFAGDPPSSSSDRMADGTAFEFLIFVTACSLVPLTSRAGQQVALFLATFGVMISLVALVAYVLDPNALWKIEFISAMSPLTAFILFLLFVALLMSFTDDGWVRTLLSDGSGGRNARRYVPIAIFGPVFMSYAGLYFTDAGLRYTGFHLGVITVITVGAIVAVVLWTAGLENERQASANRENAQLRAIIDCFDNAAVFILDRTGSLRMQNNLAQQMFKGHVQKDTWFLEEGLFALSDRLPLTGAKNPVTQLIEGSVDQDVLVGWTDASGTERALNFSCIRIPAETPQDSLVLLSVEDQTESWLLRAALSDNQRFEGVGQLAWGVAHEMANIFGIVQISAESARLEAISKKTGQNLDAILQACRRGTDLTHKLLEMTRNIESEPELLNVADVVKTVSDLAERVMPSFITFNVRLPDHPCMLRCVRTDLEGAVLNLLANSRNAVAEAGQGRGLIELDVTEKEGVLEIAVADDGPGIPDDLVERVRDPYFSTRQSTGGRGIGLTLVDTFASRVNGTFQLLPRSQGGTRATLRLPVTEEVEPSASAKRDTGSTDLTGYRILVAESDPPFRRILTDGLRAIGAEVATAAGGHDALDWLANQPPPDIIITNFKLPDGVEGKELAKCSSESRVIYLSGTAETHSVSDTPSPSLVLGKPVHLQELANAIEFIPPLTRE